MTQLLIWDFLIVDKFLNFSVGKLTKGSTSH